jgi:hypothetical protein
MDIEDPAVAAAFTSYQGLPSAATFRFPLVVGHMRGIAAASIGSAQTFDSVTAIFDADTWLRNLGAPPGPVNNRKIFTSSGAGYRPSKVAFTPGNAASLAASLSRPAPAVAWTDDEAEGLIERVYAGWRSITGSSSIQYRARLGGVDRSSLVVVGDSPVVGGDRPTVIYFGATDGMIHAVCANDTVLVSPCTTAGQELWAYLPPNQLGLLWNNTQRIDGQPLAMDVFGNFDNSSDGTREWKTLLVFQSGNPNGTSSAYALDISDPTEASVSVMWERPLAGVGLGVAAGPVRKGTFVVYSGFFLTNNGTGNPAGIKALALDLVDGSYNAATNADEIATRGWSFSRDYPIGARSLTAGDLVVLATGIPEGLAAVDLSDDQSITHVVFPTLTGEIYKVDAKSVGAIPAGLLPFASIEENYHPLGFSPAIFREVDGQFYAVFGTGGYVDPVAASWYQTSTDQFMFGVLLDDQAVSSTNVVQLPNMLTSVAGGATGVAFRRNLGTDQRVFGSVTRIGDSLFVTADSQDANLATYGVSGGGTAKLYQTRIDSGDNVTFTAEVNVVAGANTPKVIGGEVKVAGATQIESVNATIGGGRHADIKYEMWNIRRLWLKTQ